MALARIRETKSVSVDFPAEKPAFRKWGDGYFTSSTAGTMGGITTSGYVVAALRWKCEQFAQAKWCVTRTERQGKQIVDNIVEDHPALPLLKNPCGSERGDMTAVEFYSLMLFSYEVFGIAYAYTNLHPTGRYINKLQYIPNEKIRPVRKPGSTNQVDYYEYTVDGKVTPLDPRRVIAWRQGRNPSDPLDGWSPLRSIIAELGTEARISAFNNYLVGNMGVGARVISPKSTDDALEWDEDVSKKIQESFSTLKGSGIADDVILGYPADVHSLNENPESLAIKDMNLIPLVKAYAVLNVDPSVIPALMAYYADSKGADSKTKNEIAYKSSIYPLGVSFGQRLSLDVLPDFGNIATESVTLDIRQVWQVQEDQNKLWERLNKSFLAGRITLNESRVPTGHEEIPDIGEWLYTQFPQLINGNATQHDAALLDGTNNKLANESDRAVRPNVDDAAAKTFRKMLVMNPAAIRRRPAVQPEPEQEG